MKRFAHLFAELDQSTATLAKVGALKRYFAEADPRDAAWAVYFLAGGKPRQVVPSNLLWAIACRKAGIDEWLFDACYQAVGDLAETIALIWPAAGPPDDPPLGEVVARLHAASRREGPQVVEGLLDRLDRHERHARRALNFTPSENTMSPLARLPLVLDAYSRYFFNHMELFGKWMFFGGIEAGQIAQNLRKSADHVSTILIALTSDEPGDETYSLGFNDAFKKPFDGALLAERVRRLISQKKADEP